MSIRVRCAESAGLARRILFHNSNYKSMKYTQASCTSVPQMLRVGLTLILVAGMALVGCDSGGGVDGSSTTISGTVTTSDTSSSDTSTTMASKASSKMAVEGATVTAVRVGADGSTSALEGQATTDENGTFTLTVDGTPAVVRLNAEGDSDFSSSVIVQVDGQSQVQAQPMTAETAAEAEVYVGAKSEDEASNHDEGVTAADVAMYVNETAATDINAGQTQAADVATAIASSVEAESQMNTSGDGGASAEAVAEAKATLYSNLQSGLATASNAEERAQVVTTFENGMANLFVAAEGSAESQARTRQTSTSIMIEFSAEASNQAEMGLRQQAELLRAAATARAEEAIFEAQEAGSSTMDALADARQQLKADIRAATSVSAIVDARSTYQAAVKTQMESAFGVSGPTISAAETEIEGQVTTLFSTLSDIGGVLDGAVETAVNAYGSFYENAQASATTFFEANVDSDATAEAAAEALVFVNAQGQASS